MSAGIAFITGYNGDGTSNNVVYRLDTTVDIESDWREYSDTRPDTTDYFALNEGAYSNGSAFDGDQWGYFILGDRKLYRHNFTSGLWEGPIGVEFWSEEPQSFSISCDGTYFFVAYILDDLTIGLIRHKLSDGTRTNLTVPNDLVIDATFVAMTYDFSGNLYVYLYSNGYNNHRLYRFSIGGSSWTDLGESSDLTVTPTEPVCMAYCNNILHFVNCLNGAIYRYNPTTTVWDNVTSHLDGIFVGLYTVSPMAMIGWGYDGSGNGVFRYFSYPNDPGICPQWGIPLDPATDLSIAVGTDQKVYSKPQGYGGFQYLDEEPVAPHLYWLDSHHVVIEGGRYIGAIYNGDYRVVDAYLVSDQDMEGVIISLSNLEEDTDVMVSDDNTNFYRTVTIDLSANIQKHIYFRIFSPIGGYLGSKQFTAIATDDSPFPVSASAILFYILDGIVPQSMYPVSVGIPKAVDPVEIPNVVGCMVTESVYQPITINYAGKVFHSTEENFRTVVDNMLEYLSGLIYIQLFPGRYVKANVSDHDIDPQWPGENGTLVESKFTAVCSEAVFYDFNGTVYHTP